MTSGRDTSTNTNGGGNNTSTNSRLSRISFRPRPIDVSKPMPIIRDIIDDDQGATTLLPILPTGMEPQEEEESHLQEIIQASQRVRHDQLPEIPIPVVKIVDGYDTDANPNPYHHTNPNIYISHKDKTDQELDVTNEYDADSDDEELVNQINTANKKSTNTPNSSKKAVLSIERLESIIDRFEKELHYYGACDQSKAEQICKGIKPNFAHQIYQHWLGKRKVWKNSMIRRLLRPPDREDPSPYKAFRPREENPNKQKKARKNDSQSLQKMQQLRQEFERARTLLEMMKKRERLKKEQIMEYSQLYDNLIELAQIRSQEEDISMPAPVNKDQLKKKKDSTISNTSTSSSKDSLSSSSGTPYSAYLLNHNYPGPAFTCNDGQQILSNGKARQEGYRHYVPKPGQYPTPSIDKQYSQVYNLNATSPLSKSTDSGSSLSPINVDSTSALQQPSSTLSSQSPHSQQVVPVLSQDLEKEKLQKDSYNEYFNSISIPTCSSYYDDDEYNDSDDSDNEDQPNNNNNNNNNNNTAIEHQTTITNTNNNNLNSHTNSFYDPNIIPQPKLNAQGQPIYPSFNQGYIFLGPNYPPILGKVRAGRYGGTYIDFLPIEKSNQFLFYQNQLKLFNQKLQNEQQELQKLQQKQQPEVSVNLQQHNNNNNNYNNNNNNLQQLPTSPSQSTSHLNSPIDNQCNNILVDNNQSLPTTTNEIVMDSIENNNIDTSMEDQTNILKRKLNSYPEMESQPTKKLLITDFDGFTPIPVVDRNGHSNGTTSTSTNTTPTRNGSALLSPLTKSLKFSTKSNKNRHSTPSTTNNSPTIDHYFTKKLSPTT